MTDLCKSDTTNLYYNPKEMVKIISPLQACLYIQNHATLYDLYVNQGTMVFLFSKKETHDLYKKWLNRELQRYGD